jgi:hypothetical protein
MFVQAHPLPHLRKPVSTSICHCTSCRRAAGAESVGWAVVSTDRFTFLEEQPVQFNSSPGVTRTFCGHCGTTLTFHDCAETVDVTLASLDDPERLPPTKEVWLQHRVSWNPANDRLTGHLRGSGEGAI